MEFSSRHETMLNPEREENGLTTVFKTRLKTVVSAFKREGLPECHLRNKTPQNDNRALKVRQSITPFKYRVPVFSNSLISSSIS